MRALWLRVPILVRAILIGLAAATAGTLPWALLVSANTKYFSVVPWAVPIMAGYLLLYWRYVRGGGWPQSTAAWRRTNARANPLTDDVWAHALIAGVIGLIAVLLLQGVLGRLVLLPQQRDLDVSRYPAATALLWVLMSAIVAGVVEETSFRGYMQRPIEPSAWSSADDPSGSCPRPRSRSFGRRARMRRSGPQPPHFW
jgi:membrane protease YdiL (CAAX protease family)